MTALAWQWAKGVSSPIIGATKAAIVLPLMAAGNQEPAPADAGRKQAQAAAAAQYGLAPVGAQRKHK